MNSTPNVKEWTRYDVDQGDERFCTGNCINTEF